MAMVNDVYFKRLLACERRTEYLRRLFLNLLLLVRQAEQTLAGLRANN